MRCLTILAVYLFSTVNARVIFQHSEVLQAADLAGTNKANFKCVNACKVYVDRQSNSLMITQNGKIVATFDEIIGENMYAPIGVLLPPGDNYFLENRSEAILDFVMYVVDSQAPNYGATIYLPKETIGIAIKDKARFVTILSSFEAMWFYGFTGVFPAGYPRIYATGYDAADEQCRPVYQARSQNNAEMSWPTIASAVFTIDFGFVGAHNASVNVGKIKSMTKSGGMTTVYTSPGFVGCLFNAGQNYYSKLSSVDDTFTLQSESLDISAVYNAVTLAEPVYLRVYPEILDFINSGSFEKHYNKGTFAVEVSWNRQTASSSWAIQLDFGVIPDTESTTVQYTSTSEQYITDAVVTSTFSPIPTTASTQYPTDRSSTVSYLSTTSKSGRTLSIFATVVSIFVMVVV